MKDYYSMTDKAISEELGQRLKALRLRKNWSQEELVKFTGLSNKAVQNAEKGTSTLLTYIKILRPLKGLDQLESLFPESSISPMQKLKMKGKQRQRATGTRKN
ncbi:MAG: helix-turn-helix transcriptional regulator [Pseudomonadota bacterium]